MELVFDMLNVRQFVPPQLCRKTFTQAGGVIGRGGDCDWSIPDSKRHVSHYHALISYRDGAFFLTDTSRNGIHDRASGARLRQGHAVRIEHGSVYVLGDYEIRARLERHPTTLAGDIGVPQAAGSTLADDSVLDLDPLTALDQQEQVYSDIDALIAPRTTVENARQHADYALIEREHLRVPELIDARSEPAPVHPANAVERPSDDFWGLFGDALGVDLQALDREAREALALHAARLLRQSVDGLQQSLRTRSELKNELRLAQTTVQGRQHNALKVARDTDHALSMLLQNPSGHLPAEQAIDRAFRDLQAHQVALVNASRAALRGTLEHFSPRKLILRFERDHKPLLATSGRRWTAYCRYHQALSQDDDWSERVLARDFAQAYEEQVRLISALHPHHPG
ncbi:type VI secretion system-associated FHA domain protein TagH [Pseudomonas sp. NPDC098747]|uniref:type VI secretion system-associated FHA domain protein TagH n=1 Tax=Pseudomonas sp. NPDC098747 TaxID=3364487 RepID=UPI00383A444C